MEISNIFNSFVSDWPENLSDMFDQETAIKVSAVVAVGIATIGVLYACKTFLPRTEQVGETQPPTKSQLPSRVSKKIQVLTNEQREILSAATYTCEVEKVKNCLQKVDPHFVCSKLTGDVLLHAVFRELLKADNKDKTERLMNILSIFIADNRIDLNAINKEGMSPMHMAASAGFDPIMSLLLEKGASVDVKNTEGKTPLHLAIEHLFSAIVEKDPKDEGPMKIISMLIDDEAIDVNAKTKKGLTPMHLAAVSNLIDIMPLLLNKGAIVDEINNDGDTPLHFVCGLFGEGGLGAIVWLLENGANPQLKNKAGSTPFGLLGIGSGENKLALTFQGSIKALKQELTKRNLKQFIAFLPDVSKKEAEGVGEDDDLQEVLRLSSANQTDKDNSSGFGSEETLELAKNTLNTFN
ncbi:MAG: hypothetical protein K1000chlam2_00409 [Chlamydiae bacterium]|nr:hypothetical protein [Chlamydiota bacterium]